MAVKSPNQFGLAPLPRLQILHPTRSSCCLVATIITMRHSILHSPIFCKWTPFFHISPYSGSFCSPTLGLQIAQSRPCLHTLGPKVGIIYIHGALSILYYTILYYTILYYTILCSTAATASAGASASVSGAASPRQGRAPRRKAASETFPGEAEGFTGS